MLVAARIGVKQQTTPRVALLAGAPETPNSLLLPSDLTKDIIALDGTANGGWSLQYRKDLA